MQCAAGIPQLTGLRLPTPDTSDDQQSNDTDILIRLSKISSMRGYSSPESDDLVEDVWNDHHWTEADWKQIDQLEAKAQKSVHFGPKTTQANAPYTTGAR